MMRLVIGLSLLLVVAGCAGAGGLSDAQTVWCEEHTGMGSFYEDGDLVEEAAATLNLVPNATFGFEVYQDWLDLTPDGEPVPTYYSHPTYIKACQTAYEANH